MEYKRGVDAGVINQGLFYLAWLMDHRAEFEHLVRDRLGMTAASQVLWSGPRLICIAGDFTRYDVHAVREHRRSIDLVRYRLFGSDLLGLETVASVSGGMQVARRARRQPVARAAADVQGAAMMELAGAVDEVLLELGDGVNRLERKTYRAYQRLRNFACLCPPQRSKLLVYLKVDPKDVDLVPGLELVSFGEPAVADESAGDAGEGQEVIGFALVAAVESAAAGEPGHRAFNRPTVPSEPLGRLDALAGDAVSDAATA